MGITEIAWLEICLQADSGMSGKELDFIEDLDHVYRDRIISEPQHDWLKAIAERSG